MITSPGSVGVSSQALLQEWALTPETPLHAFVAEPDPDEAPLFDMHSACEVGVVLRGRSRRIYEGVEREMGPGDVWLCGVWEPHGRQILEKPTRNAVVLFRLDFLWGAGAGEIPWGRLFLNPTPENRTAALPEDARRDAMATALEIVGEYRANHPYRLPAIRLALQRLLLPVLRASHLPPSGRPLSEVERITRVMEMVRERLPDALRLEDACRAAALGRSQFSVLFRRTTGITFGEFVQRARIGRAARDILATDAKLSAIAGRWGFTDESHMHRIFRKFYRCTPAQYRRRYAG
jgi:AraC-like DNA-binding protein